MTDSPMPDDPNMSDQQPVGSGSHTSAAAQDNHTAIEQLAGRKRRASQVEQSSDDDEADGESEARARVNEARAKKARKGDHRPRTRKKKLKSPSDWHMTRKEIPEDTQATKVCVRLSMTYSRQ